MHTDPMATRRVLAAAMSHPTTSACAWCTQSYEVQQGVGVFCSETCRDAELTGGIGPILRSASQVEQNRRATSTALCTCGDQEREHGTISRACLKMKGGRFDGSSDQRRCRCKKFVAAEPSDTLSADLLTSVVLAQGKAIAKLKEQVSGLLARETV